MAWVWWDRYSGFKLRFESKSPIHISDVWRLREKDVGQRRGLYRANVTVSKLERTHCPYVEGNKPPVVDDVWKAIIRDFVPKERVSFIPLDIQCKDGISDRYWWVNAHDSVRCIDPDRSDIYSKIEKPDITLIFGADLYIHHDNCLGDKHLAYDEQMSTHLVLSDALRDALAATGESSMFFRAENLPIGRDRSVH